MDEKFHRLLQINPAEISSLVDVGMEIRGEVRNNTERAILISGTVIGSVISKGPVIINEGAEVHGSITALSLQLAGVARRQTAQDRLIIAGPVVVGKTATLGCDVECDGIQTEWGAKIDAACRPRTAVAMQRAAPAPAVTAPPAFGYPQPPDVQAGGHTA